MERLKKAVTVILLIIACIFVTILVDLYIHPDVTKTAPAASPASIGGSATAGSPQDCNESVSPDHQEPFITINPVPHYYIGDSITFNGTTNLQKGELIRTGVLSGEYSHCIKSSALCPDSVAACCDGISGAIPVTAGACGINTWSWEVNTSLHGFAPDRVYIIYANGRDERVNNFRSFTVSGIPQSNITLNLPENDPDGHTIRLSGQVNTGNGPDEKLFLSAASDSGRKVRYTVPVFQDGTGYSWTFSLNKSDITPYNFLTVNVSSQTSREIIIERTFLYNNEPSFYPYNPYSP